MTQDLHPSWTFAHLNTSVMLPDVVSWELTGRTRSWMNVMWLQGKAEARLRATSDRTVNVDLEESLFARAKFRSLPDASRDDLHRVCQVIRDEIGPGARPVIHYSGRRLASTETDNCFWLNDDQYSGKLELVKRNQVEEWLGAPEVVYLYECDSAEKFLYGCGEDDKGYHLAACGKGETLPKDDVFSGVISLPVKAAYGWHCAQSNRANMASKMVVGDICDRQILMGQLDWVLTLILDAIARDSLPKELFQKLFRGDLLTATIFRRFILSQRIMKRTGCHPVSRPALPDCSQHRLWTLWDNVMDMTVMLLKEQSEKTCPIIQTFFGIILNGQYQNHPDLLLSALSLSVECPKAYELLKAGWIKLNGDVHLQECIVEHAVKILQSGEKALWHITTKFLVELLAETPAAKELLKPDIEVNLLNHLHGKADHSLVTQTLFMQLLLEERLTKSNSTRQQALSASCVNLMTHHEPIVRLWAVLLGAKLPAAECPQLRSRLEHLLNDADPKVRAAAIEACVSSYAQLPEQKDVLIEKLLPMVNTNSSSLVRRELANALNVYVADRTAELITIFKQETSKPPEQSKSKGKAKAKQQQLKKGSNPTTKSESTLAKVWRIITALQSDPDPEVSKAMQSIVAFIKRTVAEQDSTGGKRKKKTPIGSCPLAAKLQLHERLCRDLVKNLKTHQNGDSGEDSKENDSRVLNGLPLGPRNPTLPLLNHQLRSVQTKQAPQMVRFGANRQMFTVFKDHITWQDHADESGKTHVLKHPVVTGSQFKVTSLLSGIPHHSSSLLIGYNDGSIRLWRIATQSDPELIGAWQGLHDYGDAAPSAKTHGIAMTSIDNQQLITGGDAKYLRKWNLAMEATVGDISIGTDQAVTALASNGVYNIAAGLDGGTVRLFDTRAEADGKIAVGPKHSHPVREISLRADDLSLVSVCGGGSVHLVDLRKMIPAVKKWSWNAVPMGVAIHQRLDLVAFGGTESLEVYSIDGERQCDLQKGASCVDFHRVDAVLGAGSTRDNAVLLYGEWGQ